MVNVLVTDPLIAGYLDEPSWEVLARRPDAEIVARLPSVDVLVASRVTPEMAAAATNLRLLHVPGAGLDRIALDALPPQVTVCNTFHHGHTHETFTGRAGEIKANIARLLAGEPLTNVVR